MNKYLVFIEQSKLVEAESAEEAKEICRQHPEDWTMEVEFIEGEPLLCVECGKRISEERIEKFDSLCLNCW